MTRGFRFSQSLKDTTMASAKELKAVAHNWGGSTQHHIDHIIPRSLADRKALMATNLPESRIARILDSVNRVGNLQLLLGRENLEKSNIPFGQWIQTRDSEFLHRHLIPNKPALWDVKALPEFVDAREELIRQRLRRLHVEPTATSGPVLVAVGERALLGN
jgi:hypothetical protein